MNSISDWTRTAMTSNRLIDGGFCIRITRLRVQNSESEVAVQIVFENGEHREQKSLLLTMDQYCELRPVKGEISEEQYEELERASELCMALRCGEHLLSYGSNSVSVLSAKIVKRGFSSKVAAEAAGMLCEMGLIDEEADVRREVEKCVRKLWGGRRIRAHLWSRGFASESLAQLPMLLEQIDFAGNCERLICKHYGGVPEDADERRRMTDRLCRYGYTISEIREAYRALAAVDHNRTRDMGE